MWLHLLLWPDALQRRNVDDSGFADRGRTDACRRRRPQF
jgi:hypothetical protein